MVSGRRQWRLCALAVLAAAGGLCGCADLARPDVDAVATGFASGDPATRCALLAPATLDTVEHAEGVPCEQAIAPLAGSGGEVLRTEVWGTNAQVRLTTDTLFLTSTGAGWRVAAAGCVEAGDAPYRCRVAGP